MKTIEDYLEYIAEDVYLEVTPDALRIRKILLSEHDRKRMQKSISN